MSVALRAQDSTIDERRGAASAASTVSTFWPSFTKSWPCTMILRAVASGPATQTSSRASSTIATGTEATMPSASTVRTLSIALGREGQGGARHAHGGDRREPELDLGGHAVGDRAVGVVDLDLDPVGARLLLAVGETKRTVPFAVWPVTSRTLGRIADA